MASVLPRTRWSSLAASVYIQLASGASYCFGIYSPALKASQSYSQSALDAVAVSKDIGANVGVASGLLLSAARRPWIVLAVGAAMAAIGYLPMWMAVVGAIPPPPIAAMCAFMFLAAQAQTFFNTANVVVAVENFGDRRGTVIGIMKGFLGLSGAVLVQLYRTMFNENPSTFILMLVVLPSTVTLLLMFFVEVHHTSGGYNKKYLDAFSLLAVSLAGYLMVVIICDQAFAISSAVQFVVFAILLLFVLSPIPIVMKAQATEAILYGETSCDETTGLLEEQHMARSGGEPSTSAYETCKQEAMQLSTSDDYNLLQAMCTLDFWLLFLAMACGMGSGLATVNNISQIGSSLGYTAAETSTLVSLWSIWNFTGRFGAGYVSDHFLRSGGYGRPLFIAATLAMMSAGHVVISSGLPGSLYIGYILVGICYGSQWNLMPTITSEIFGLEHFGTIFNTVAVASPFGSYILSVRVIGYLYDMEADERHVCTGKHCFALSFIIMALACLLGSAAAAVLFFRTRKFYRDVIYTRLKSFV